jgi:integrase/recombinase XerD
MVSTQIRGLRENISGNPLGVVIASFMDYLAVEAGLSENTILAYGRDLRDFAAFGIENNVTEIHEIDPKLVYSYLHHLSIERKAESSINRGLVAIKMLLRFALLAGLIDKDFTAVLEGPKPWKRLPAVCRKDQVNDLLNAPDPKDPYYFRDKAILETLYATGSRASEVAGLKVGDVNLAIGYLRVFGKGKKERIIPLGSIAGNTVKEYLQQLRGQLAKEASGDFVFLSRNGRPLDRIDIWRIVKKYARRAGMPRNLTVHTLRHCFATHLLAGGADLRSVQEMLGHVDIATTQIYTHVDQERLRSIHKQFHPRG